jgi:hypothetical protein
MRQEKITVVVIDAEKKEVRIESIDNKLEAMQGIVGGLIERAWVLSNGDDLYVNEEGLLNGSKSGFVMDHAPQPYMGSGFIVGHDGKGNATDAKTAKVKAEHLRQHVNFF